MKKKTILLLGVLGCLVFSGCAVSGIDKTAQNNSETQTTAADDAQGNEDAAGDDTETSVDDQTEAGEDEEAQDTDAVYNVGDSADLVDWQITVKDIKIVDSIAANYGSFSPNTEGGKFVQLFVTVVNNGKKADNFLPSYGFGDDVNAKVLYGDGYEFSATNLLGYDNELHDSTINPLSSKDGEIVFEIPENVSSGTEELYVQFKSGNDIIKFKIR